LLLTPPPFPTRRSSDLPFHPRGSAEGRCQTRNDGMRSALNSLRHCERSAAIQRATKQELDCFVASAPKKKQMAKALIFPSFFFGDRKSTRLNSSHEWIS